MIETLKPILTGGLYFYGIGIILFLIWCKARSKRVFQKYYFIGILILFFILGCIGAVVWEKDNEVSQIGSAMLAIGPAILPGLFFSIHWGKNTKIWGGIVGLILTPIISTYSMILIIVVTGQVWNL